MKNIVMMVAMTCETPTNLPALEIDFVISGTGPIRASRGMQQILKYSRPEFIIFTGFCAYVDAKLSSGQLIVANGFFSETGEYLDCQPDPDIIGRLKRCLPLRQGKFQSFSHMVFERGIVAPEVTAVDMETYYYALAAHEQNIPFLAAKVTCDLIPEKKEDWDQQFAKGEPIWPTVKPTLDFFCPNIVKILRQRNLKTRRSNGT